MRIHTFNKLIISLIATFICVNTYAEYRVYQYMVSPRLNTRKPASFIVTSTLDPKSYVSYHGGNSSIRVNLLKTWTCKGHTGAKSVCNDPMAMLATEKIGN